MHELSICQSIFQSLEEALSADDMRHLHEIHLDIGVLSGIEPLYLQSAFELMVTGTPHVDVRLLITHKQIVVECHHCRHRFTVENYRFICTACGETSANVIEGNELKVSRIVIEEPEEAKT